MHNVIMRRIAVTEDYRPLADGRLVASVEICAPPTNSGPVYFLGDDGSDVFWIAGESHFFRSVNLAEMVVKGTPGDCVCVIGGTWRD